MLQGRPAFLSRLKSTQAEFYKIKNCKDAPLRPTKAKEHYIFQFLLIYADRSK